MSLSVEENVFRLECNARISLSSTPSPNVAANGAAYFDVAVEDVVLVQESDGVADLGAVEAGTVLAEPLLARQVKEELAAVDVVHDQAEAVRGLKRIDEALNK